MTDSDKRIVQVEEVNGHFRVTLHLSTRWEAWRLAVLLTAGSVRTDATLKERARWKRAAKELKKSLEEPLRKVAPLGSSRVTRPPADLASAEDRQRVIDGIPPYPVLPVADVAPVWRLLEKQGLYPADIADRLHVSERTVFRWRRNEKGGSACHTNS